MTKEWSLLNVRFACIPTRLMYEQPAAGRSFLAASPGMPKSTSKSPVA